MLYDSNGESNFDIIPKKFDISESDTSTDKYGFSNSYKDLFEYLQSAITTNSDYEYYDLTFFSYDWRQSCADSATDLNEYISQMGYESVVLVCHSMGGLVGSGYMAKGTAQRDSVEQYISFGTPHWGTVVTPTICLTGEIELFFRGFEPGQSSVLDNALHTLVTDVLIRFVVSKFPSVYEMFPTDKYVSATGGYLTYDEGELCTTYSETKAVYAEWMKGYNASLMNSAESFHNSLYVGSKHITEFTHRTLVYSNHINTVQWLTYDPEFFGLYFLYTFSCSYDGGGDGMVPMLSATMNESQSDCAIRTYAGHIAMIQSSNSVILDEIFSADN